MTNIFKKVILTLSLLLITLSCGVVKHQTENITLGLSRMTEERLNNCNQYQIDSLIVADTLPRLNRWLLTTYVDYETNEKVYKRMCIKKYSNGSECAYIIIGSNEPYKITKRITE